MLDARLAAEAGSPSPGRPPRGPPLVARPAGPGRRRASASPASASTSTASPRAGSRTARSTSRPDGHRARRRRRRRRRPRRARRRRSSSASPTRACRTGALAVVRLPPATGPRRFGLATSGDERPPLGARPDATAHHLIDPATWRPAETDVVQATVLADSARAAEAFAKTAVLAGSDRAPALLDRPGVLGASCSPRAARSAPHRGCCRGWRDLPRAATPAPRSPAGASRPSRSGSWSARPMPDRPRGLAAAWESNRQSLVWLFERVFALPRLPRPDRVRGLRPAALDEAPRRDRPPADHLLAAPGPRRDRRRPGRRPRDAAGPRPLGQLHARADPRARPLAARARRRGVRPGRRCTSRSSS